MKLKAPSRTPATRAFTLIELLVVIAIIAILAALILGTSGFVQEKAGIARATSEMKALEVGLENYKIDNGVYPVQVDGKGTTSTKILITELAKNPIVANKKPYFDFPPKMLNNYKPSTPQPYDTLVNTATNLVDPFGNPYHYQSPGDVNRSGTQSFDLWSQGKKNSETNEDLWIKNW